MSAAIKPASCPGAALLVALLVLTGCGRSEPHGRWTVIPASAALEAGGGADTFSAWRLDTMTGDLELCQYASRLINGRPAESLKCSLPVRGPMSSVTLDISDPP